MAEPESVALWQPGGRPGRRVKQAEGRVLGSVALAAAAGLALLTMRSMAYAFASSVDRCPPPASIARGQPRSVSVRQANWLTSRDALMLYLEIALSIGIALSIVGLAATAALPGRQVVGALLAQMAALGSLVAPPVSVSIGGIRFRPAALGLGLAQLANLTFFVSAILALS